MLPTATPAFIVLLVAVSFGTAVFAGYEALG
jgi:hypothetical protein